MPVAAPFCFTAYLNVQLLIICACFSLILFGFIWLANKREAAMLQTIGTQKNDLRLALKGTGEAIWTWRLDTADAAGTGPRAIVFKRSLDVVKGVLPVVYETLPPQYVDRMVVVHASGRCGGVILRGPGGIRYFDDI